VRSIDGDNLAGQDQDQGKPTATAGTFFGERANRTVAERFGIFGM